MTTSGHRSSQREPQVRLVDWNDITARYTEQDDLFMRSLRSAGASDLELATLHELVGLLDARLVG